MKTLEKYTLIQVSIVRTFLRYYVNYYDLNWSLIQSDINEFIEEEYQKENVFEVSRETIRQFGESKNKKKNQNDFRIPELESFEAIVAYLSSEKQDSWLPESALKTEDIEYVFPAYVANSIESNDPGLDSILRANICGAYFGPVDIGERKYFSEFVVFNKHDDRVLRVRWKFIVIENYSDATGHFRDWVDQIVDCDTDVIEEWGWMVFADMKPSVGFLFERLEEKPVFLSLAARRIKPDSNKNYSDLLLYRVCSFVDFHDNSMDYFDLKDSPHQGSVLIRMQEIKEIRHYENVKNFVYLRRL